MLGQPGGGGSLRARCQQMRSVSQSSSVLQSPLQSPSLSLADGSGETVGMADGT